MVAVLGPAYGPAVARIGIFKGRYTVIFAGLKYGDWRALIAAAAAALICGFFWELWNYKSLARWEYAVPFVDRFHIFAMPILGYGGYLPFGWECLLMGHLVLGGPLLKIPARR